LQFPVFFFGQSLSEEKLTVVKNNLSLLNEFIGQNKYVCSDRLSIADLSLHCGTSLFSYTDIDLREYPSVFEWYERLEKEIPHYEEITGDIRKIIADYAVKVIAKFSNKK
jgi:glutathione S-transferase